MSKLDPYENKQMLVKEIIDTESRLKRRPLTSAERKIAQKEARQAVQRAYDQNH